MQTFQFYALPVAVAEAIYRGDSTGVDVHEVTADAHPGYPCRLSLEDATVGETLYALSYEHQAAQSPYRASGPIFVRRGQQRAEPAPGVVPAFLRHRQLSLRGYSAAGWMVGAAVMMGTDIEAGIESLFAGDEVTEIHVHNAKPGCYMCAVRRV